LSPSPLWLPSLFVELSLAFTYQKSSILQGIFHVERYAVNCGP